ncbi:MAG TPA: carboxypeptidase-like regulatory domain-containing protein [Candidatus Acidoferrum sp.]|nr:carboxypeptidase-like regulatory domain-containing protein [Candidatus Acidoferrum sp.]
MGWPRFFLALALAAVLLLAAGNLDAQSAPAAALLDAVPPAGEATLKICLRLEDETPFRGAAMVRVAQEQGNELLGMPADEPGEYLFSGVTSGKYAAVVSAPGYTVLNFSFKIGDGPRQKSLFVPMQPRFLPASEQNSEQKIELRSSPLSSDASVSPMEISSFAPAIPEPEATPTPAASGVRNFWAPHELEQSMPPVDPAVSCPAEDVLRGVGARMSEFVQSLERFTATEKLMHFSVDRNGALKSPETREFAYVVSVSQNSIGTFLLDEFRDGKTDPGQFPAQTASRGSPAMALIFHPVLAPDFEFRCEGLGQWAGRQAWQVHFVQRPDHPIRIRSYSVGGRTASLPLLGRVWIDPGTYQVLHLESELVKPLPEVALTHEHFAIDYQPVRFQSTGQQLWLPQTAELYVERKGKRFYRRHAFSDFRLFNVDSSQKIQTPGQSFSFTNLSDRDISGELTIESPEEVTRVAPLAIRFTVPAHSQIFKLVGRGKDIDLPPSSVASATFLHDGDPGAIKVDTHLARGASLDVVSTTKLPTRELSALPSASQAAQQ